MEPWYKVVLPRQELREGRSLNTPHSDGSDERRMLEGVQAAMRGIR